MAIVLLSIDREILVEPSYTNDEINKACQSSSDLIISQKKSNSLDDEVDSFLVPTEVFYIRGQFPGTDVRARFLLTAHRWCGQESVSLSYQELREMPSETRAATLECAGNSHVFLLGCVAAATVYVVDRIPVPPTRDPHVLSRPWKHIYSQLTNLLFVSATIEHLVLCAGRFEH